MSETKNTNSSSPNAWLGLLMAPIAVLVAILADVIAGFGLLESDDGLMSIILVGVAGILAAVPRILKQEGIVDFNDSTLSLGMLVVAVVVAVAISGAGVASSLVALTMFAVIFFGHLYQISTKYEMASILIFGAVGFHFALVASGYWASQLPSEFDIDGQTYSTVNQVREAVGFTFFTWWTIFAVLGVMLSALARGNLNPSGEKGWFGFMNGNGACKSHLPLHAGLTVWLVAHILSYLSFSTAGTADQLNLIGTGGAIGYIGWWQPAITGLFAMIVVGMVAERWLTRAMIISSLYVMYQITVLFDMGMLESERLSGAWGPVLWLGITFFVGLGISLIANNENFGQWAIREEIKPSKAKQFWSAYWAQIMIGMAVFFGFIIRINWYAVPSMNAFGVGGWDMTGGSDPWYMKRVVDYIMANNAHLIYDADRFYPHGGINPRPPLFSWSMALGAMALEPFLNTPEDAVWYAMLGLPAVYGALTVLPIAAMAKDHFGKSAGVVAAWLIALMPGHITHSTWALADHDAFVMLFISVGFLYYFRALKSAGNDRLTSKITPSLSGIFSAFGDVIKNRGNAVSNAALAGAGFGVVALGWKGFVVGPSILFLAYFAQISLNLFRKKDSTALNVIFLTMLTTIYLMVLPFYGHPQLNLILDSTGLQPLLFVTLFVVFTTFITTGFRDKPWLMVLGGLVAAFGTFLVILYLLKLANITYAWDTLFSGSGYFAKTKIFGTVAEANAPDRGRLFASFGPIVFILALCMGIIGIWRGLTKKNQIALAMGIWVIAATYMSWTAARFIFNATPAMAVLGAWGVMALWNASGAKDLPGKWRRMGIRTPKDRYDGARKVAFRNPQFLAISLVLIMLAGQHATYGLDAAIPASNSQENELDEELFNVVPTIFRWDEIAGISVLDGGDYEAKNGKRYLGSFGSGFNDQGWNQAYAWLAAQDTDDAYSDRPAFVSWWDYGFQALETGEHPSVSDNFQSGIPATGNMLLARSQEDLISMWVWQLSEGDIAYNNGNGNGYEMTSAFEGVLGNYLNQAQLDEFVMIQTGSEELKDTVVDRTFQVTKTNRNTVLAEGHHFDENGIVDTSSTFYRVYKDGIVIPCEESAGVTCAGTDFIDQTAAENTFNNNVRTTSDTVEETTHYIIGDYWYTADMIEEYESVSTSIHRKNAKIALAAQLFSNALESEELVNMYNDLMDLEIYTVQDYDGAPGDTITRDHEIRYFAVDDRLYPRAGRYTADRAYNGGQPMGIFAAPTILSGQDVFTFMNEVYETSRGSFQDEMTREEVDEAIRQDVLNQQAGADIDPLQVADVRVDHTAEFFNTMVARTYVGYGASTLGIDEGANPQPAQHFGQSGSPGSILSNALPLPGAMMNHFVISNWYEGENPDFGFQNANTNVKILKFYAGAEISGQVTFEDNDQPLSNVRLLIERDAFSGEDGDDQDSETYWVPIGFVDTDDNGEWSFLAPAGHIRISAYVGEYDPSRAQDAIVDGSYSENLGDILTETNDDRVTNEITAILGNVANMTWVGESHMNVTGAQADREESVTESFDLVVESSGVSGMVTWTGDELFNGDPLVDTDFILRDIFSMDQNFTLTTTAGEFSTDEERILQGTGQVTFTEDGYFQSEGVATVTDFTGNYTREIIANRIFSDNGTWNGAGEILANWIDFASIDANYTTADDVPACEENNTEMPDNMSICAFEGVDNTYLFDGEITANGRVSTSTLTTLSRELSGESIEGSGIFEGTGTVNGTGTFRGIGDFSGEMVQPGSFYITGLLPGIYNMIAQLDNGKEVLLPDPVEVGITSSYDLEMTIPGSIFADELVDLNNSAIPNMTIEVVDDVLGVDDSITITTDENGSFAYGPLSKGNYYYRVDVDSDGWYEMNNTFVVGDESQNITLPNVGVPTMYDMDITLVSPVGVEGAEVDLSNRVLTFTNDDPLLPPINATSDDSGMVYIELPLGMYTVSDETDEDYILFERLEVMDGDLTLSYTYQVSVWVNGTLRTPDAAQGADYESFLETPDEGKLDRSQPASSLLVNMDNDDFHFESITDENGSYSFRLPVGQTFYMTAASVVAFGHDDVVVVADGMDNLGISYLEPIYIITGSLYHVDNTTTWDNLIPGFEPVEVTATSADGTRWTADSTDTGTYVMRVTEGAWNVTIRDTAYAANSIDAYEPVDEDGNENPIAADFYLNPGNKSATLNVFSDSGADGVFANGTAISPEFSLVPITIHGERYNVTADDYTSSGVLTIDLAPGAYYVEFDVLSASDANATDYSVQYEYTFPTIEIGLEDVEDTYDIVLRDEYLLTGSLTDAGLDAFTPAGEQFLLVDQETNNFVNVAVDSNGTFAEYVPAGDWVVVVAPEVDSDNNTQLLRQAITISSDNTNRISTTLTTSVAMEVEFQLTEALTEANLSGVSVVAESQDGLGNVTLSAADSEGMVSDLLMPGNWVITLNRTGTQKVWTLESNEFSLDDAVNNTVDLGVLAADLEVEIGGKVFWDLNENDVVDSHEGVEGVNVTIIGGDINETLETDADGVWTLYVPIRSSYNVTVAKEGFSTETYNMNNTSSYIVEDVPVSEDLELSAGIVAVSGTITDATSPERLNDVTVTLYPQVGFEREPVAITDYTVEDGTLSWNANVQPGDWIVYVRESNPGVNNGGVGAALLDATIANGGEIDMNMALGGWVELSTSWTDFETVAHHAGSSDEGYALIDEEFSIEVDLGEGIRFYLPLDVDGNMELLLPAGNVRFEGEFSTTQRELTMEYSGAVNTGVADARQQLNLNFARQINSDLTMEVVDGTESGIDFTVGEANDDGTYDAVEFDVTVTYEGTEEADVFAVTGTVGSAPDSTLWNIEFLNGTEWVDSMEVVLGIGESSDTSTTISVRVTPANESDAWHLDNGHRINVRLQTDNGDLTEESVNIQLPQTYGISVTGHEDIRGIGTDDQVEFGLDITNDGNGDDTITISVSDNLPAGWEITPEESTFTIANGDMRTQLFTLFSPETFTDNVRVDITVTGEDGSSEIYEVTFQKAQIELTILQTDIIELSDQYQEQVGNLVVRVNNIGYLDTEESVIVYIREQNVDQDWRQETIQIDAQSYTDAVFEWEALEGANHRFEYYVEVAGSDANQVAGELPGEGTPEDFQMEFFISDEGVEQSNVLLPILVIGLVIFIIYGAGQMVGNRGGKAKL